MPTEDNNEAHKFPFNSSEILGSDNGINILRFLSIKKENQSSEQKDENSDNTYSNSEKSNEISTGDKKEENETDKKEEEKKDEEKKEEEEKKDEENGTDKEQKETAPEGDDSIKKDNDATEDEIDSNDFDKKAFEFREDEIKQGEEEKEVEENFDIVYEIFDHALKFLDVETSDENYLLIGYFAKIINSFLQERPKIFLSYIIEKKPEVLPKFIMHINRRGIGNTLEKIISLLTKDIFENYNEYVVKIFDILITPLLENKTEEICIENICEVLINSLTSQYKENLIILFTSQELLEKFEKCINQILLSKDKYKISDILRLLIKLNEVILKDFENKITQNFSSEADTEIDIALANLLRGGSASDFVTRTNNMETNENLVNLYLDKIIKFLTDVSKLVIDDMVNSKPDEKDDFNITYSLTKKQTKIGVKAVTEWEYFRSILDILVNSYNLKDKDEILTPLTDLISNSKIFETLVDDYFKYPMNNMFQNFISQIISVLINDKTPKEIINSIFDKEFINKQKFFDLMVDDIMEKTSFVFESGNMMNSILLTTNVYNLLLILNSNNERLGELYSTPKHKFLYDDVLNVMDEEFSKNLLFNNKSEKKSDDNGNDYLNFSVRNIYEVVAFVKKIYNMFIKGEDYKKVKEEEDKIVKELKEKKKKEDSKEINADEDNNNTTPLYVENLNEEKLENEIEKEVEENEEVEGKEKEGETEVENDVEDRKKFLYVEYWKTDASHLINGDETLNELKDLN